mmetsp:Transcript_7894/g.16455  ORF Transcript_7894/g.16455 Transcript_7894/m.16455 type:complete len:111 (+) Transcript_7894:171-503(+)
MFPVIQMSRWFDEAIVAFLIVTAALIAVNGGGTPRRANSSSKASTPQHQQSLSPNDSTLRPRGRTLSTEGVSTRHASSSASASSYGYGDNTNYGYGDTGKSPSFESYGYE